MEGIIGLAIISTAIMFWGYQGKLRFEPGNQRGIEREAIKKMYPLFIVMGVAFLVKSIAAMTMQGHGTDYNCFASWSDRIHETGITKFYAEGFSDYPPGYMYILYVTAAVRKFLGIDEASSLNGLYLIKLFPILCDMGTGFLIYKLARKRFSDTSSIFLSTVYMLNPAIVLNSSIWCQVDSVFTLTVLLMCYFCMEQKRVAAYFIFALGILLKPQTVIFTPILIFAIIDQVFLEKIVWKEIWKELGMGLLAIASMFAAAAPYGLIAVIEQYKSTLGSYQYATVNAYNFWMFLGKNWADQNGKLLFIQYRQWGMLAIVVAVGLGALVYFKNRKSNAKYFLSSAIIIATMFAFSVRMHERYNYPIVGLLLIAYILKPRKEFFYLFVFSSVVHFLNVAHVLYTYVTEDGNTGPGDIEFFGASVDLMIICSIALLFLYGYTVYHSLSRKEPEHISMIKTKFGLKKPNLKRKKRQFMITPSEKVEKMKRLDYFILFSILVVYSMIAFYKLGSLSAPGTAYSVQDSGKEILLDLGIQKEIGSVWGFSGGFEHRKLDLTVGNDRSQPFDSVGIAQFGSVYSWEQMKIIDEADRDKEDPETKELELSKPYRYIKFTATQDDTILNEIVLLDKEGNVILPVNGSEYTALFDEQELFDKQDSYMSGTYFDEIYHARTAKEMIDGKYCYENTHPPLGKFFISLGIRAFGMNPFGWRFVGTLFGVLMLPFFYMFGKRMFRKTWAAAAVTLLFAFDFMHFTQTRIATIDVYGTFFILAMYYFMYCYTKKSFYDTELWKTFIPLVLCGVCMGLGMASKWTAVYAGAGLGLILFAVFFVRWREYQYAKKNVEGVSGSILHTDIVRNFKRNMGITVAACVVFFVIIPGLIYLLSYIPFIDGVSDRNLWERMIENQKGMFDYHSKLVAEHPYSSWWYEWPTMIKPIYYHSASLANGLKEGISAFGNPLVWWAGIPCLGYMLYLIWKERDRTALFIVTSYFVQLAPWMLVTRIVFIYHYFPSVPFVVLMIGQTMVRIVSDKPKRIKYALAYVACAIAVFMLFYPVLSGIPTTEDYIRDGLRWMNDWVLG